MTHNYYPEDKPDKDPLLGVKLNDGWTIVEKATRHAKQTGGSFSYGYIATRGTERAFMKAYDFERAFAAPDPMKELENLVSSYNFERELFDICSECRMSHVVKVLSNGTVAHSGVPFGRLYYLLFELADSDARVFLTIQQDCSMAWRMRCLQQIATALQQLHFRGIYHQDTKPSNVLVFGGMSTSKLGDLGRAHCSTKQAPHDGAKVPGAFRYAPPELLYGAPMTDARQQRGATDLYLFGSMVYFIAMGLPMTPELMDKLMPEHKPIYFGGRDLGVFFRDVLPFVVDAHGEVLQLFETELLTKLQDAALVSRIVLLLRYATTPDPALRGHPAARRVKHGDPYDLQRFISELDLIARALEWQAGKANA
jgi:serine/threonine protein kinase